MSDGAFDRIRRFAASVPIDEAARARCRERLRAIDAPGAVPTAGDPPRTLDDLEASGGTRHVSLKSGSTFKIVAAVAASLALVLGIVLAARPGTKRVSPITSSTSTSTTIATAPACRSGQLTPTAGGYGEAGGQFSQTFILANHSGRACVLSGWPRFWAVSAAGRPQRTHTERVRQNDPTAPAYRAVTLKPGDAASFAVYSQDWNAVRNTGCPETSGALVQPTEGAATLSVHVQIPDCAGTVFVAPFISGRTDRQAWSVVVK
jgi:hypothetical protein